MRRNNLSDPSYIKEQEHTSRRIRDKQLADMRILLAQPEGRRFVWRFLEHCKVFESIWHPSALIHHNSGRQDVGHFLMGEVVEAGEDFLLQMMKENKEVKQNER